MKEPKPWVLPALEWGPLLLFFAVFMLNRGGSVGLWGRDYTPLVFATLVFIPTLALATLIRWRLTGKLSPMQIATLLLVAVFGGLSVWLNDPRFFKIKPTIIYLLFSALLGPASVSGDGPEIAVVTEDPEGIAPDVVRAVVLAGGEVVRVEAARPSLEAVYFDLVGADGGGEAAA